MYQTNIILNLYTTLVLRISLTYIISIIILSLFFVFMTLKQSNYFNQFGNDFNIEIIAKNLTTQSIKEEIDWYENNYLTFIECVAFNNIN